jgi:hypothetical protein
LKNAKLEALLPLANGNFPSLRVGGPEQTEWLFIIVRFGKQWRLFLAESDEEEPRLVVPPFHPG